MEKEELINNVLVEDLNPRAYVSLLCNEEVKSLYFGELMRNKERKSLLGCQKAKKIA